MLKAPPLLREAFHSRSMTRARSSEIEVCPSPPPPRIASLPVCACSWVGGRSHVTCRWLGVVLQEGGSWVQGVDTVGGRVTSDVICIPLPRTQAVTGKPGMGRPRTLARVWRLCAFHTLP